MFFFGKTAKKHGWLAITFQRGGICLAHVQPVAGGRPAVRLCRMSEAAPNALALEKLARELRLANYRCTTLLNPDEYQILLVDAPSVPAEELKTAIRWSVKGMLDYPVDEATFDLLEIPPDKDVPTKSRSMYAIAAPNKVIRQRQALFEQAGIALAAIDIPEMAQRNISTLLEPERRGLALLSFGCDGGLLTVAFAGELYLSRRIDISLEQLARADEAQRTAYFERITLEMQRSLDHFDRQFHFISLSRLMLAPLPGVEGLREYLAENLYVSVENLDLAEVFDFSAVPELAEPDRQALFFCTLGAALRHEEGAA